MLNSCSAVLLRWACALLYDNDQCCSFHFSCFACFYYVLKCQCAVFSVSMNHPDWKVFSLNLKKRPTKTHTHSCSYQTLPCSADSCSCSVWSTQSALGQYPSPPFTDMTVHSFCWWLLFSSKLLCCITLCDSLQLQVLIRKYPVEDCRHAWQRRPLLFIPVQSWLRLMEKMFLFQCCLKSQSVKSAALCSWVFW